MFEAWTQTNILNIQLELIIKRLNYKILYVPFPY